MKNLSAFALLALVASGIALVATPASAQFEKVEGKAFDSACVRDFYLEGNAIPTQKRNTVVLKGTDGKRVVASLLDTSGYSNEIQQKYAGMLILEKAVSVGGAKVAVGAYGFGLRKPQPPEGAGHVLRLRRGGREAGRGPGGLRRRARAPGAAAGRDPGRRQPPLRRAPLGGDPVDRRSPEARLSVAQRPRIGSRERPFSSSTR